MVPVAFPDPIIVRIRRLVQTLHERYVFVHNDVYFMIAQLEREELLRKKKHMYWRHPSYQMGKRPPGLLHRTWNAMIAGLFGPPSKVSIDEAAAGVSPTLPAPGASSDSVKRYRVGSRPLTNS